jgi:hypothetical protein
MYQVNRRNSMDITDVLALILGMQAGLSFLSRISKYLLEKCNWMNYSEEENTNLILNENSSNNKQTLKESEDINNIELSSNLN